MRVPGGLDEVRDRLRHWVARPRALVPTAKGVFLLGPAPVVVAELEDTAEVASGPGGSSVALAWDERHVRVHVRRGDDRAVGIFERWEALHAVAVTRGVDQDTALRAADDAAREVPCGSDDALGADGVERWAVFLERAGFPAEGRALRWIAESDVDVPAHRRRWWELAGERSTTQVEPGSRSYSPSGLLLSLVLGVAALIGGGLLAWAALDSPMLLLAGAALLLAAVCALAQLAVLAPLAVSRSRRTDPFPVSDPLDLRAHLTALPTPEPAVAPIARYEAEPDYLRGGS